MELSKYLREYSRSIAGKEQLIISAFAKALEIIPRQLCDNAGFDSTSVLNKLRQKHATGKLTCFFRFKFVANFIFFWGGGGAPVIVIAHSSSLFDIAQHLNAKFVFYLKPIVRNFSFRVLLVDCSRLPYIIKINFWEFLSNFSHRYSQGKWSGVTQYKNL